MCEELLAIPLKMTFEAVLDAGIFPNDWQYCTCS